MANDRDGNIIGLGDIVKRIHGSHAGMRIEDMGHVAKIMPNSIGLEEFPHQHTSENFRIIKTVQKQKEVNKMNSTIAKMYEKTVDAVLVDKHFGEEIPTGEASAPVFAQQSDAILKLAKAKEEKAKT